MLGKYALGYVVIFEHMDVLIETLKRESQANARAPDNDTNALALALMGGEKPLDAKLGSEITEALSNILERITSRMIFRSVIAQCRRIEEAIKAKEGPKALSLKVEELKTRCATSLTSANSILSRRRV
jgi:hypothetical protein